MKKIENETKTEKNNTNKRKKDIIFWSVWSTLIVSVLCLHFIFNVSILLVDGNSMQPHYHDKQLCGIANFGYKPEQGDVICFKAKKLDDTLVKRVIATEGQTVYIDYKENKVFVDGKVVDGKYAKEKMYNFEDTFDSPNPMKVPKNCVFVLGDNRNDSLDSRSTRVGTVSVDDIIGKVYGVEHD